MNESTLIYEFCIDLRIRNIYGKMYHYFITVLIRSVIILCFIIFLERHLKAYAIIHNTKIKDLFLLFFYWKGGYTERRDRQEDLPSDDSLPK